MLGNLNQSVLNINPLVAVVDDFLSDAECNALISLGAGRLARATVHRAAGHGQVSQRRTNDHCALPPETYPQVLPVLMKLGLTLRIPVQHAECPMLLHYTEAQEFKPHSDGIPLDADPERLARFEKTGGQRLFSTLIYLNEVEAGGGTGFPELDLSVSPKPGRLLIFANTMAGSRAVANLSVHAGEPVTAGEKWAVITWWREQPFAG